MQLEINGNKYGLQWGTRAFVLAEKRLDMNLNEIIIRSDEELVITTLSYCAIQNWLQLQDETAELPFSYTQFCAWLDDADQKIAGQIANDYLNSSFQGKSMKARYDEINAMISEVNSGTATKPVKKKKLPAQG